MQHQTAFTAPPQRIADMPMDEQPGIRLDSHGPTTLSDAELLCVLLDTPTLDDARMVAELAAQSRANVLMNVRKHLGPKAARRYSAALELHRRLTTAAETIATKPQADLDTIARRLIATYGHHTQERLGAIALDSRNGILAEREIYVGTVNHAAVSTRDLIVFALNFNATAILIFHNHPSGDPKPSAEDLTFTRKLAESLRLCDIDLRDHIVVGANRFYSMRQRGQI